MVFEYILKQNGITPSDVNIVQNIDFGSTAAAFSGGQGDFTVEFEPHASLSEQQGAGYVVASLGEASGYVPYTAYCVRKSYLNDHQTIIQGFTNAIQKGLDYVNSHSAEEIAHVISPQFTDTDEKTIATIVDRYKQQNTWNDNTIFRQESFDLLQDILMDANELEERVPYEDLIITRFSENAISNPD